VPLRYTRTIRKANTGQVRNYGDEGITRRECGIITPKGAAMTRRVRLKAAEKYVGAIKTLSPGDEKKLLDGIAVIFDVIEKTRRDAK